MIIDVHAHCIPEPFREWLDQHGASVGAQVVDSEKGQSLRFANRVQTGSQFGWDSPTDTKARLFALAAHLLQRAKLADETDATIDCIGWGETELVRRQ